MASSVGVPESGSGVVDEAKGARLEELESSTGVVDGGDVTRGEVGEDEAEADGVDWEYQVVIRLAVKRKEPSEIVVAAETMADRRETTKKGDGWYQFIGGWAEEKVGCV
ncbi:uncharacterized protein [Malus domestica]|uniref:uncharacterized protein n=1 Tax=Malus domestica TaxID=3750 RepID=UPI003975D8BA